MPAFRVSKAAQKDIESIGRYTQSEWGAPQRRLYLAGLNDKFEALSLTPAMARERQEFDPPVRIHPYEKHLIVYIVEDGGILIVRVVHRSMEIPAHLTRL